MTVLDEVAAERARQDGKWGGAAHDDEHSTAEFVQFIEDYAGWARQMASMNSPDKARRRLLQVAALAVAAVESMDRRTRRRETREMASAAQVFNVLNTPVRPNLKPCPFCGSERVELVCANSTWYVECNECLTTGSAVYDGEDRDSERAVEIWNRLERVGPPFGIVLNTPHAKETDVPGILRYLLSVLPAGATRDTIEAAIKRLEDTPR